MTDQLPQDVLIAVTISLTLYPEIGGGFELALNCDFIVAEPDQLESVAKQLVTQLADGPTTLSYAATRTLLKTWSSGGVARADIAMLDVTMGPYNTEDAKRGFANTAEAFDRDEQPGELVY